MSDLFKIIAWAKASLLTTSDTKSFKKALDAFQDELPDSMKTNKQLMKSWIPALCHAFAVTGSKEIRDRIAAIFSEVMIPLKLMPDVTVELRPYLGTKAKEAHTTFLPYLEEIVKSID